MVKYKSMKPAKNKGSELQKARKAFNNFLEDYLEDEVSIYTFILKIHYISMCKYIRRGK